MAEGGFDVEAYRRQQMGQDPDKALLVSFEYVAEQTPTGEWDNVPYIRIWIDKDNEIFRRVTKEDKERFIDRWEAFQRNEEEPDEGTPIKVVPFATPANVSACKAERIKTAEQLVETADERLQKAHLINFKYQCRDWIESRTRNGYTKELTDRIRALEEENAMLQERFQNAGLEAPVKKKRGRPRKKRGNTEADSGQNTA